MLIVSYFYVGMSYKKNLKDIRVKKHVIMETTRPKNFFHKVIKKIQMNIHVYFSN